MKEYISFFNIFTFSIIAYFIIFLNRGKICLFLKTIDSPHQNRRIHKLPTPKSASYSVAITFIFFLIYNLFFLTFETDFNYIVIGSLLGFLVGFYDDRKNLNPYSKLFLISLIYICIINFSDKFIITKFYTSSYDTFINLNNFAIPLGLLSILLLVNAFNLADGVNGIATGLLIFWLIFFLSVYEVKSNIFIFVLLLNLIIIFYHNYHGKHFLGDSGSLMFSIFIGLLSIKSLNENILDPSSSKSAEFFILIFLLPGIDMFRLFIVRIYNKKNPFKGDLNHIHHLLIKNCSLKITLLIYFLTINVPIIIFYYFKIKIIYLILLKITLYFFLLFFLQKKIGGRDKN